MAIGVAAVVTLTALGDGARRYVVREFSAIGSNLVIVLPGAHRDRRHQPRQLRQRHPARPDGRRRAGAAARAGRGPRRAADGRHLGAVGRRAPARRAWCSARRPSSWRCGSTRWPRASSCRARTGNRGSPLMVLGAKVRAELFPGAPALGQFVRVGDRPLPRHRRAGGERQRPGHEHRRTGHRAGVHRAGDVQHEYAVPHPGSRRATATPSSRPSARSPRSCARATTARRT